MSKETLGRRNIHYYVLPSLVERARDVVGAQVHALTSSRLRGALPTTRLRSLYYRWRIQRLVDRLAPVAIVFNTAEPAPYFHTFRQVRHPLKIGIVHNPRRGTLDYRMRESGELVFCLHDYNYRLLEKDKPVDGYLSPFFKYRNLPPASGSDGRLEIAVQGVISFSRRDYPLLIRLGEELTRRSGSCGVVFNILGDADIRDGPRLRRMISARGLERFFTVHRWLPDDEFFRQFQRADYVMPLVSPRHGAYADGAKVTAAFGHSGAYGMPLILQREVAALWGVPANACVAYSGLEDLADQLIRGLADQAERAQRYQLLISRKIQENQRALKELSRDHTAFAHTRQ